MNKKMTIEGSFEFKIPTTCTDEKQRWEESEKRGKKRNKIKEEKIRRQKTEDAGARKGSK